MEFFGRRKIYTTANEITAENVVDELNRALGAHYENMLEEDYLYWYRRGRQPVLEREKAIRPEINHKVVVNFANIIVLFKNGYLLMKPANYIARKDSSNLSDDVARLNDYLYLSGKHDADNDVVDWFHTVGVGVLYVEATNDEECPCNCYSLDPRQSFVVYSRRPGNKPMMGVNIVGTRDADGLLTDVTFDVFTDSAIYRVTGEVKISANPSGQPYASMATEVIGAEMNAIGEIPIIEYVYDRNRMGAFEAAMSIQDELNDTQSSRLDGIDQFIQSLMVFYNCQLGEDADGNPITPAYIREAGAIFLKSVGQDKADLKILTEQLDQSQTQVLVDDLFHNICTTACVPFTTHTTAGTSDNVGAVYLRNGWAMTDTSDRNTEELFRESNRRFDRIFTKILRYKTDLDINPADIALQFPRGETENILVKAQAALNLKQLGLAPELVLAKSGVSTDPVSDVEQSKKFIDMMWRNENAGQGNDRVDRGDSVSRERRGDTEDQGERQDSRDGS